MLPPSARALRYESVPHPNTASFTFREFRWARFPFNWHYHPELELTLIVAGRGLRFVGDSAEEFAPGDLCLLGANTPHCWASHAGAPPGVRSLVLQFRPEAWGEGFLRLPEVARLVELFDRARRGLAVEGATRRTVAGMVHAMTALPAGSLRRLAALLDILERLAVSGDLRPLAAVGSEAPARPETNRRLGKILEFIHAHLGPDLSESQVARAVGLSPDAFSQFFRRTLGKPYIRYVNELRVQQACRALIESDQRISEVALAAGFNNLSHFNAQFRRFKETSPRAFRQRARTSVTHESLASPDDRLGQFR